MIDTIIRSIIIYLPSYVANSSPVVLGGGTPLDRGLKWLDGKPFLGSHKTIRGCVFGILAGSIIGLLQGNFFGGIAQSVGAILGDLISSFFKRRMDFEPGASVPLLDQLNFIVVAIILSQPYQHTSWVHILTILVITAPIHYAVNYVAWLLKLKSHPW